MPGTAVTSHRDSRRRRRRRRLRALRLGRPPARERLLPVACTPEPPRHGGRGEGLPRHRHVARVRREKPHFRRPSKPDVVSSNLTGRACFSRVCDARVAASAGRPSVNVRAVARSRRAAGHRWRGRVYARPNAVAARAAAAMTNSTTARTRFPGALPNASWHGWTLGPSASNEL